MTLPLTDVLEKQVTKLSFAVFLIDDYSKENPIGRIKVSLKNRTEQPIKTPSSYYAFVDLFPGIYTVHIESDYYLDPEDKTLNTTQWDPLKPLVIRLKPNPSYPFPPGATLIRGTVCDPGKSPKAESKITLKVTASGKDANGKTISNDYYNNTITSKYGDFVLYFSPLKEKALLSMIPGGSITFEISGDFATVSEGDLRGKTSILSCNGDFHTIP